MADDILPFDKTRDTSVSRREMVGMSFGAATLFMASANAQEAAVVMIDVNIKTADGTCDAALFHPPGKGTWPGVIMFTDILGLRPAFRDMGRRLAAEGYTVLVPNPFYRTKKAPILTGPLNFSDPKDRAKLTEFTAPLTDDAKLRDITTYVKFLDKQKSVNTKVKLGVTGYCMGGPYTMLAAAYAPDRVGAAGSFHGGGLVTDKPNSPHLLVHKMKVNYYFGIAANDDKNQPTAKDVLKKTFADNNLPAKIEVYSDCQHGWCVSDGQVYNKAGADRAFGELTALYKTALV